jgi:hypothetical protein
MIDSVPPLNWRNGCTGYQGNTEKFGEYAKDIPNFDTLGFVDQ